MEVTVHNSSLISHIRYNNASSELTIQFKTGNVYVYQKVSQAVAGAVCMSDSPGETFNRLIRNDSKRYPFYKNNRLAKGITKVATRTSQGGHTKPRTAAHKAQQAATTTAKPRARKAAASKNIAAAVENVIQNVRNQRSAAKTSSTTKTNSKNTNLRTR